MIVDGYSAGNLLPAAFQSRGITPLHVQSTREIWPILTLTYKPGDYAAHFAFTGDLDALVQQVKPYSPLCVIAGTDITTPKLHQRCVGFGQLDLTVDSYIDHAEFHRKTAQPYQLQEFALSVSLISEQEGRVKSVPGEKLIASLASFDEARFRAKPGYQLRQTIDFYTNPGFVMLVHPDPSVLENDLATLRNWEKTGQLYELEN